MTSHSSIHREPILSSRPYSLAVQRHMPLRPPVLYQAWTKEFDRWFAARGSVLMTGIANSPFFFETEFRPDPQATVQRFPHYGRFLQVVPDKLVQLTWLTGATGTKGAETVVTVELSPEADGTLLRLTHAGFYDEESMDAHRQAWPFVLEQLERSYATDQRL